MSRYAASVERSDGEAIDSRACRRGERIARPALDDRIACTGAITFGVQVRTVDAREGYVAVRVVHDGAALVVGHVHASVRSRGCVPAELAGL